MQLHRMQLLTTKKWMRSGEIMPKHHSRNTQWTRDWVDTLIHNLLTQFPRTKAFVWLSWCGDVKDAVAEGSRCATRRWEYIGNRGCCWQ